MGTGRIGLYTRGNELLTEIRYEDVGHRRMIIEKWKKQYGVRMGTCYFIFTPIKSSFNINWDGTNSKTKKNYICLWGKEE